ncbi:hypothetical protein ON010_g10051 [Phytophthora cinnamomi]|nr:hypothetical protein ON010_g10051 [Phytophthora cinnamomi]
MVASRPSVRLLRDMVTPLNCQLTFGWSRTRAATNLRTVLEDMSSPRVATGKRRRSVDGAAESDEETKASDGRVVATAAEEVHVNGNGRAHEEEEKAHDDTAEDGEEEEEEALVVLELCDFKNHPLFDDYSTATLELLDREVLGNLELPLVTVGQQLGLVVQQLLVALGGELEVRALDDGVHGARLLAEAAVDALGHVDVVARSTARAISAGLHAKVIKKNYQLSNNLMIDPFNTIVKRTASMVMAWAGQIASQSLQAMQLQ